jgi:hypothetical protein
MTLNFIQISELINVFETLKDMKMPFKLSLILAKNIAMLEKEYEFYLEREREFALKYLQMDENGTFIQEQENVFKIKEGLEQECQEARMELNKFESEVALRKIPVSLIENMEFTPNQLAVLEILIEEEE